MLVTSELVWLGKVVGGESSMMQTRHWRPVAILFPLVVAGCGLYTPNMNELGESDKAVPLHKADLINEIKCEIQHGVYQAKNNPQYVGAPNPGKPIDWILGWTVKVDLQMTVDDKGTFGPGVTATTPFGIATQSFSLALGLGYSTEASHKEETGFTYNVGDLYKITEAQVREGNINPWKPCAGGKGVAIYSDLKIEKFINDNLFIARPPGVIYDPFNAFNDTLQFIIVYSGNATPSWKLVRFSINPSSPFVSAMRTRTQYLTLTFGPPPPPTPKPEAPPSNAAAKRAVPQSRAAAQPSTPQEPAQTAAPQLNNAAEALHQSNLIGQAVLDAIRSGIQP